MTQICIILFVLALLHFVYQSVILPTISMHLRFKLFSLRDNLRRFKMVHNDIKDPIFSYLQISINNAIKILPQIDLKLLLFAHRVLENNKSLLKRINERNEILDSCPSKEFQRIRIETSKIIFLALISNSGGWFFYIIPILMPVIFFSSLSNYIKNIMTVPEGEIDKIISNRPLATA